ncbi:MAG TPA: universal stress protein [Chloroflexota bacterium]|nr:universal stress protein [Chloroflexota bacterium]
MRRILVPLDGSTLSAAIIPDARRLAGRDGELILVQDVWRTRSDFEPGTHTTPLALDRAAEYLESIADRLRAEGVKVRTETLVIMDRARGIDDAARIFKVDMIACATHARTGLSRMVRGSIAWDAMAHSPVPVLLRHPEQDGAEKRAEPDNRRILVPLDGSDYSEKALPLAAELAREWGHTGPAALYLTQVIPDLDIPDTPYQRFDMLPYDLHGQMVEAQTRLDALAAQLPGEPRTHVVAGDIVDNLMEDVGDWAITDIVLASHGRSGLSRVIVGSVTDALIQRLHCPIIVVPALVAEKIDAVLPPAQEIIATAQR